MLVAILLPVLIGLLLPAVDRSGTPRQTLTWGRDLRPLGSAVTARHPAACPVATSEAQLHSDGHKDNEADVDRQGPGRPNGGVGPWTHR
jgi:hypothetical protein